LFYLTQLSTGENPVNDLWLTDDNISSVDGKLGYFKLLDTLSYRDNHGIVWETPAGSVSDLSSFPWYVRMFTPSTILVKSPFQHDYHYKCQPVDYYTKKRITRKRADQLYRDGAVAEGLDKKWARTFYAGLRAGGWLTWWKYRRADKGTAKK
jgi:hypothetical protein